MAPRMSNKLVALCSAAIGVVYMGGYLITQPTLPETVATPPASSAARPLPQAPPPVTRPTPRATAPTPPTPAPKTSAPTATGSKYKDGTYTGRGTNRIGSIEVTLTVKADKITDVRITDCTTHYRQSLIDGLPAEALARQSAQVDVVSGATKSTQDFRTAVEQALAQAAAQAKG